MGVKNSLASKLGLECLIIVIVERIKMVDFRCNLRNLSAFAFVPSRAFGGAKSPNEILTPKAEFGAFFVGRITM